MRKSNETIFENIELLDQFIHLVPKEGLEVIDSILRMKKPLKPRVTHIKGWGKIQGKSHNDLIVKCVDLLDRPWARYLETKKTFKILLRLSRHSQQAIQSKAIKSIENLCKYDFFALQSIGFRPQQIVLSEIERLGRKEILTNFNAILTTLKELLQLSFEGHSNPDYKTLTLHFGPLKVTDEIVDIRKRAIEMLKKIYLSAIKTEQKTRVISVLQEATQTPHQGGYGEDMEQMVLRDTERIIDFYINIIREAENEIIQDVEEQKIWFLRRFGKEKLPKIQDLEEVIASNKGYSIFRVFVGYDGRLNPDYSFEKDKDERTKKIKEFVANISEQNFGEWRQKILSVVKNYSSADPGAYSYFNIFLQEMAQSKPSLAIRLINENEKELEPFLLSLIVGVWQSTKSQMAKDKISEWLSKNKHLSICAFIFSVVNEIDESLLKKVFQRARTAKNIEALNTIIRSIVQAYPKSKNLKSLFLDTIKELTKNKNTWWINHVWYKGETILKDLSNEDFEIVLDNLNLLSSIDYHAEEILKPLAERQPERIIDFFHDRVKEKTRRKRDILRDRYDAVPFNLHELKNILKEQEKVIVPKLLKWYDEYDKKHNWFFGWEASHLFEDIFPDFSPVLEQELIIIVKKKNKKSRDIVFSVLSQYKGSGSRLWNIVRVLVDTYAGKREYKEVEGHLFGYLSQTGVVSGEYGLRDAYKNKKDALGGFKKDKDKNFRKFVENYEKYLDQRITYEQKHTDEEIELMKRGLE